MEIESQIKEEKEKIDRFKTLKKDLKDLKNLEKDYKSKQEIYKNLSDKFEKTKSKYDELYKLYFDNQAGILAESLKEGECCPVCGSKAHPHLAVKNISAPTETELKKCENQKEKDQKEMQDASVEASKENVKIDELKNNILLRLKVEFKNMIFDNDNMFLNEDNILLKSAISDSENKINSITKELEILENNLKRKKEIENIIPKNEKDLNDSKNEIEELNQGINATKSKLEVAKSKIEELEKTLKYKDKTEAEKEKQKLEVEKEKLNKDIENTKVENTDENCGIEKHSQGNQRKEEEPKWGYLTAPMGGINLNCGNSISTNLSHSRQGYIPLFIKEKCINCGLCFSACPDMVFQFAKGEYKGRSMMVNQGLDYEHCKGCLRCVDVCPVNALVRGVEAEQETEENPQ